MYTGLDTGAACASSGFVKMSATIAVVSTHLKRMVPELAASSKKLARRAVGLPVLLRIGCDAQIACASRLSRFTLLGIDPTLRGLRPCISRRYLKVPFRGARRTGTVTSGLPRGMQR
jgi:hypothetical protein